MDLWTDCVNVSLFGRLSQTVSAAPDSVNLSDLPSLSGHDGWMDGWIACEECLSIR